MLDTPALPALSQPYAALPEGLAVRIDPDPVAAPRTLAVNGGLARELGIDPEALAATPGVFTGNAPWPGAAPGQAALPVSTPGAAASAAGSIPSARARASFTASVRGAATGSRSMSAASGAGSAV